MDTEDCFADYVQERSGRRLSQNWQMLQERSAPSRKGFSLRRKHFFRDCSTEHAANRERYRGCGSRSAVGLLDLATDQRQALSENIVMESWNKDTFSNRDYSDLLLEHRAPAVPCKIAGSQAEVRPIPATIITPTTILLEASSVCQLACPSCPTAEGKIKQVVKSGFLKFELFKQIVDRNKDISDIELSNWGEIFLNPELPDIMEYAYRKGVNLRASNGVNLNTVNRSTLEALVKYRFRFLSCSIDGASPEIYEIYRRRGNLSVVLENIRIINSYKKSMNSPYPKLKWQFVVHGHNEHEIKAARELANELDMTFYLKLQWGNLYGETFSPVRDPDLVRREHPDAVATRDEYDAKFEDKYFQPCFQLWQSPQINFDGKVLGCCVNHWGDFGVVDGADIQAAVNNEKMVYAREMLQGRTEARGDIPCSDCEMYKTKVRNNDWLIEKRVTQQEPLRKIFGSARNYNTLVSKLLTAGHLIRIKQARNIYRHLVTLRSNQKQNSTRTVD